MAEADTHAWWADLDSILPAHLFRSLPSQCLCFCIFSWLGAAEWELGVRVVMAGYEYVSPEQLAGFDKYKVARAPRTPLSLLSPAAPRRLRSRRDLCHLVPHGSVRAGGRLSGGPAESWGIGDGVRGSILGPLPRLGTSPGVSSVPSETAPREWSERINLASLLNLLLFLVS